MGKEKNLDFSVAGAVEFLNKIFIERPVYLVLLPLILVVWFIEKWVVSVSNWAPLAVTIWAAIQYGRHQRQVLVEDLNKRWKRIILEASPTTPLEQCEWLNKLLMDIWPNHMNPKLSGRFSSIVEKRLKHKKPRFIERIELQELSLGSCPPSLGLNGVRWTTIGEQRIMHLGFDWDTSDLSILLLAKLGKPLYGTARIVINHLHIKGEEACAGTSVCGRGLTELQATLSLHLMAIVITIAVHYLAQFWACGWLISTYAVLNFPDKLQLMPILDGKAVLYSFLTVPEVRIGVAFGSGGSQSLPATELPGVSSWLDKLLSDTLVRTMVEPRRLCFSLPTVQLGKKAVGGILHVTVVSARNISRNGLKESPSRRAQNSVANGNAEGLVKDLRTFVEVELEELTRKTVLKPGSNPKWDSKFNMVLHDNTGILKFRLYECTPGSVKYDYLASCDVKIKYAEDDSTTFWAVGANSSVLAKHAEICGKEIDMIIPFEDLNSGELCVRLMLKEWQFSDGSHSFNLRSQQSLNGLTNLPSRTGRKIYVTVAEAKDLIGKDKSGKCEPYVRLQYGKAVQKTRTVPQTTNPVWDQTFEFEEITGGEYLILKCFYEETFSDENIGTARVNLEGLADGSIKDVWVPLEKVHSGELKLQIKAVRMDDNDISKDSIGGSAKGWIELLLLEARDLIAADLNGTSDPYVKVEYGDQRRKTKVIYKTLNPKWNQTFEFPDTGSPLTLYVRDHNAILASSSIGECLVEYQRLPPNQTYDKWIPLQKVTKGEVHVRITRKVPELERRASVDSDSSVKAQKITSQIKHTCSKLRYLAEDGDLEGVSRSLTEMERLEDMQEEYMLQLETERSVLLIKINELGQELLNSPPANLSRWSTF